MRFLLDDREEENSGAEQLGKVEPSEATGIVSRSAEVRAV